MESVLQRVDSDQIRHHPYPHVVVEDCLSPEYYAALAAAYPDNDTIFDFCRDHPYRGFGFEDGTPRQNDRYDISAFQALQNPKAIPDIWLDFMRFHTSAQFYREFANLFETSIQDLYPFLEPALGKTISNFSCGVRYQSQCDISLDCQVGINTPAVSTSSVRKLHLDASVELFAILLYFRLSDDNTPGGDLEVYRWKDPGRKRFVAKQPDPSAVELVDIVRYKPNTMVLFVNSQDSLHAVSPRLPSGHTRRLVNIIGEVDQSYPAGLYTEPRSSVKDYLRRKLSIFKP